MPILVLAGEKDSLSRLLPDRDRTGEVAAAAAERKLPFELVSYPRADHDFIMGGSQLRCDRRAGRVGADGRKARTVPGELGRGVTERQLGAPPA